MFEYLFFIFLICNVILYFYIIDDDNLDLYNNRFIIVKHLL